MESDLTGSFLLPSKIANDPLVRPEPWCFLDIIALVWGETCSGLEKGNSCHLSRSVALCCDPFSYAFMDCREASMHPRWECVFRILLIFSALFWDVNTGRKKIRNILNFPSCRSCQWCGTPMLLQKLPEITSQCQPCRLLPEMFSTFVVVVEEVAWNA